MVAARARRLWVVAVRPSRFQRKISRWLVVARRSRCRVPAAAACLRAWSALLNAVANGCAQASDGWLVKAGVPRRAGVVSRVRRLAAGVAAWWRSPGANAGRSWVMPWKTSARSNLSSRAVFTDRIALC